MKKLGKCVVSALAASSLMLAITESVALAAPCDDVLVPPECDTAREVRGFTAGKYLGRATVEQIWNTLGEDPDQWDTLVEQVDGTIPGVVVSLYSSNWDDYSECRAQGFLDGSMCEMAELNPIPGCLLDGVDWGSISSSVYCGLSEALGGLVDMPPWFLREPEGLCGEGFQLYCEDTYRYGATFGADTLSEEVLALLAANGILPEDLLQTAECVPYTEGDYLTTFDNSVYVECTYDVPPG